MYFFHTCSLLNLPYFTPPVPLSIRCLVCPLTRFHLHSLPSSSSLSLFFSLLIPVECNNVNVICSVSIKHTLISLAVCGHAAEPAQLFLALLFLMIIVTVFSLKSLFLCCIMLLFEFQRLKLGMFLTYIDFLDKTMHLHFSTWLNFDNV